MTDLIPINHPNSHINPPTINDLQAGSIILPPAQLGDLAK